MPPDTPPATPGTPAREELQAVAAKLNGLLERYSDKDWAYSRIALEVRPLTGLCAPYVLWLEWVPTAAPAGKKAFKSYEDEVTWGERHCSELGILEIISLRLNRALLSISSEADFDGARPVIRLIKRAELEKAGMGHAFWYRVTEVQGEEFDNR